VTLVPFLVGTSEDFLAKTQLGPNMMSTAAHKYCDGCDIDKTDKEYTKPFSFMKGCGKGSCQAKWKLRTLKGMLETLRVAWRTGETKTGREAYLRSAGYRVKGVKGVCPCIALLCCFVARVAPCVVPRVVPRGVPCGVPCVAACLVSCLETRLSLV
tara:strand:+ start:522 stop:989 length:468 start_codon:yes stop_codon:yes gene_type:complete